MFSTINNFFSEKYRKKLFLNRVTDDDDKQNFSSAKDAKPLSEIIGMTIRELSPALSIKAQDELGEVPSRVQSDIRAIKEWLAKQPHINANIDDQWILSFLRGCKFSLERTKEKIENYYTARTLSPEIFVGLDPVNKKFLKFFRIGACVALEKPVSEDGFQVIIMRPGLFSPKKHPAQENMQVNYMITEILMMECDNMNVAGIKLLVDLKNTTMGHLAQLTPTLAKKLTAFGEKSLPVREKGGHFLNTPPGVETMFNMIKGLVNNKHRDRLFVHNKNYEELYEHIPRKCLPKEYGGDAGPISNLVDFWEKKIMSYRNYLIASQEFKTDESKRLGKPRTLEDLYGVVGSFRKLDID